MGDGLRTDGRTLWTDFVRDRSDVSLRALLVYGRRRSSWSTAAGRPAARVGGRPCNGMGSRTAWVASIVPWVRTSWVNQSINQSNMHLYSASTMSLMGGRTAVERHRRRSMNE